MFCPDRLVRLRKINGYTQEELGNKLNTTKGTISNYENGHSTPSGEILVLLADVLNTTTDYLLGRTDTVQPLDPEDMDNKGYINLMNDPVHKGFFIKYISANEEKRNQIRKIFDVINNDL